MVLFASKAAKYIQAENKIATMVEYEIAKDTPYIETDYWKKDFIIFAFLLKN